MYRNLKQLCAAALLLFAAGCGAFGIGGEGPPDSCPQPAILEELRELVRFRPKAGQDLSDILFHVKLNTYGGVCNVDKKEITLTLELEMTALRGAALTEGRADFGFWIWILDKDKTLLTRHKVPIRILFEGQDTRIDFSHALDVLIPQRDDHAPTDWNIYVGFELSKEELAYNRRRLGSLKR